MRCTTNAQECSRVDCLLTSNIGFAVCERTYVTLCLSDGVLSAGCQSAQVQDDILVSKLVNANALSTKRFSGEERLNAENLKGMQNNHLERSPQAKTCCDCRCLETHKGVSTFLSNCEQRKIARVLAHDPPCKKWLAGRAAPAHFPAIVHVINNGPRAVGSRLGKARNRARSAAKPAA